MFTEKMQDALNKHLNYELCSSYLYLAMSAWFETQGLSGFAHWMKIQTQEELVHVQKFISFIHDRDGRVVLYTIDAPKKDWSSTLNAFQEALEHERSVTARINKLVDLTQEDSDHATGTFLQWFINEQVEEEGSVKKIVDELKLVGDSGQALFIMNRELAQRTFNLPLDMQTSTQ